MKIKLTKVRELKSPLISDTLPLGAIIIGEINGSIMDGITLFIHNWDKPIFGGGITNLGTIQNITGLHTFETRSSAFLWQEISEEDLLPPIKEMEQLPAPDNESGLIISEGDI